MMGVMRAAARPLVLACLLAAFGAACAPATASTSATPRIVGGAKVSITQFPWQVAIVDHATPSPYFGQFCGGAIIDELHVVTAAHCLDAEAPAGTPEDGSVRDIVAGLTDLGANPQPGTTQRIQIATWGAMPDYNFAASAPGPWDAALATLSQPLDLSGPAARPAPLAGAADLTPAGAPLRVSGWGQTEAGTYPTELRAADIFAIGDSDCEPFFDPGDLDRPTMLCAVAPGRDSCNGDSGGPLTNLDGTVVGLVSWGPTTCASSNGAPGVYTELAQPAIADFIRDLDPTQGGLEYTPPAPLVAPSLVGLPKSGDTLACLPGSWTSTAGTPDLDYRFRTPEGQTLRDWAASPAYTPADGDGGRRVVCVERARDSTGAALAASAPSEPVIGPPAPAPTPAPTPTPTPLAPRDVVAPRATFVSIRCSGRTCLVRVRATDAGNPISGVRDVRVTVLPGRGRSRSITAKSLGRGLYEARFTKLRRGGAWFTASARDRAGNVPATVAIRRATVR